MQIEREWRSTRWELDYNVQLLILSGLIGIISSDKQLGVVSIFACLERKFTVTWFYPTREFVTLQKQDRDLVHGGKG